MSSGQVAERVPPGERARTTVPWGLSLPTAQRKRPPDVGHESSTGRAYRRVGH